MSRYTKEALSTKLHIQHIDKGIEKARKRTQSKATLTRHKEKARKHIISTWIWHMNTLHTQGAELTMLKVGVGGIVRAREREEGVATSPWYA